MSQISSSPSLPFHAKHLPLRTPGSTRPKLSLTTSRTMAPPALGATFTVMRILQVVCLIPMVGLTSHFINELVAERYSSPSALTGTLVVSCLSTMYVAITYILYYDGMLPLLFAASSDTALLIACTVISCLLGRPLGYLSCTAPSPHASTASFLHALYAARAVAGANRAGCFEAKALWGLSVAASLMFFVSGVAAMFLWKKARARDVDAKEGV